MKKNIILALGLLTQQIIQAQGTAYLSNLDQTSVGSLAVGSNSWLATDFFTGSNVDGYVLNSIQLEMTDASGSPSNFIVMVYSSAAFGGGISPGGTLGTLNGSLNPVSGGIFTYSPTSVLTLSPGRDYFIVLTAGTAIANGAYEWSYAGANSYSPTSGWSSEGGAFSISSDGSNWHSGSFIGPQYAIDATLAPEPGVLGLLGVGGLSLLWHRRKATSERLVQQWSLRKPKRTPNRVKMGIAGLWRIMLNSQ